MIKISLQSDFAERSWSVVAVDGRGRRTIRNFSSASELLDWLQYYTGAYEEYIQYQYQLDREKQDFLASADY